MRAWLMGLPLIIVLTVSGALAMWIPAVYATVTADWQGARAYFYSGAIFLALASMVAMATGNYEPRRQARNHLLALLAAFTILPIMLAVPLYESVGNTRFLNAYVEMVSSLTTTGASLFDDPARLADADHLWRAIVGWLGGFLIWVTAIAVMAPLSLGGFEVIGPSGSFVHGKGLSQIARIADASVRLQRFALLLGPVYAGLTLALWIGLLVLGDTPLVALCHAMATLSTSGISPVGGIQSAGSGLLGEALIWIFLIFALSRRTFARDLTERGRNSFVQDPEIRMAVFFVLVIPGLLFARHWIGALEVDQGESLGQAALALWGAAFTVLSFLTTTGFESAAWGDARGWSGLETPGLILISLALIGGGVATTAGGVKLLRIYVLYRHGRRELEKLVHPRSIGGAQGQARYMRREGAMIAWIFFMLFAISLAAVMMALSLAGLGFEEALVFAIAALSTTGPLILSGGQEALSLSVLPDVAKYILAATMVLGRLETLAIIALLNPEFWRH